MADSSQDPIQKTERVTPPTEPGTMRRVEAPPSRLRQRHSRRSRPGRGRSSFRPLLKWGTAILVVLIVAGLIVAPLVYRNLRPEYRERVKHYLPLMAIFDPQREYAADTLPTVAPADGDFSAADLLLTPDTIMPAPTTTADPNATPTPNADMVIIITATPSPTPTEPPTSTPEEAVVMLPTSTPQAIVTVLSAATPTSLPTSLPLASSTSPPPTLVAMLPSARLYGFQHIYQTWNNCGPATLTMGLSYFGWREDQSVAASYLKPDAEDKNVSPRQMVNFVNEQTGVRALYRMAGDLDMIRRLILGGFPVIVETGYMPEGYDWMGHYRLIIAYDDQAQQVYAYDSFLGHGNFQGLPLSYSSFDANWQHFNRVYLVLYEATQENALREILGPDADLTYNAQHALEVARREAAAEPDNPFAWFNMGTSYVALDMFEEAARAYDQARNAGRGLPWRMLWYQFGPFEAYYEVGRYEDVLALVQANLGTTPYVEETYYWTGMVYMAREQYGPAREQFNLALRHNRNFTPARDALTQLEMAEARPSIAG